MPRVLVVEDDRAIRAGLVEVLKRDGFEVRTASDGASGLREALRQDIDLVVLDVRLPKLDGFEVCRLLRADRLSVPVLMLTAKVQEADKVLGLTMGADDYMTKPFGVAEFVARIRALLRRARVNRTDEAPRKMAFDDVDVDFEEFRAARGGREVVLTAREFGLLRYLMENPGRVVTRDELLREVWGYEFIPVTRTVDAHVAQLRKKLEKDPTRPRHITSVRSVGYRFEP